MRLLALDIGVTTGWAVGAAGEKPRFGSYTLVKSYNPDEFGPRGAGFSNWLSDAITMHRPDLISYEAPIPFSGPTKSNRPTTQNTIRLLLGMAFLAETLAHMREVQCVEAHIQTVRKYFCGSGRADKDDALVECVKRGWPVADGHQADAGAIWAYEMACRELDQKPVSQFGGTHEAQGSA